MTRGSLLIAGAIACLAVGQTVSGCWGVGRYQVTTITYLDGKQEAVLLDTTLGQARMLASSDGEVVWSQPFSFWSKRQK